MNSDTLAEVNSKNCLCPSATYFAQIFLRWYRWDDSYINGAENYDNNKNVDNNDDENDHNKTDDNNGDYGDIDNDKVKTGISMVTQPHQ